MKAADMVIIAVALSVITASGKARWMRQGGFILDRTHIPLLACGVTPTL
jgi:hypothetical protein